MSKPSCLPVLQTLNHVVGWTCSSMSVNSLNTGLQSQSGKCKIERNSLLPWLPSALLLQPRMWLTTSAAGHSAVYCPLLLSACCWLLLSPKTLRCFFAKLLFPWLSCSLSCPVGFSHLGSSICSSEPGVQLILYSSLQPTS